VWPLAEPAFPNSERPRIDDAVIVHEGQGGRADTGQLYAEFIINHVVHAVNPVVHQHLAVVAGHADAGDMQTVDEGQNLVVLVRCRRR